MKGKTKTIVLLNILLMFFSLEGIFSKMASEQSFLSGKFLLYYGIAIIILFIYAVGWQQVIKRLPLTTAYANRAVTVVWGIIWGYFAFEERVTFGKVLGAIIVIVGVIVYVTGEVND